MAASVAQKRSAATAVLGACTIRRRLVSSRLRPGWRSCAITTRPLPALSHTAFFTTSRSSSYADSSREPPPAPPKKAGFFRWTWRVVKAGLLGSVVFIGYTIYDARHPPDQLPPDESKKTLVVLGTGWGSVSLLKNLETENYNVIVVSPRNYFLFTPLLPSCTTGTIEHRSIMEPIRSFLRHKKAEVTFYEVEATKIDVANKIVYIDDNSRVEGDVSSSGLHYDLLVVGTGAENSTFGIPGVMENSLFLKDVADAQAIRRKIMDCCETATLRNQSEEERKRLLHMVVVGGGPTGVEFAGELQDFFEYDLKVWIPAVANNFKVTLIEALPNVLPMFSKQLVDYTEKTFREGTVQVRTKTMVKNVADRYIEVESSNEDNDEKTLEKIPYGLLVWATGNSVKPIIKDVAAQIHEQADQRRGLAVNEYLQVKGTKDIWAVGDCAIANYAPTAQVASQEGAWLASFFNRLGRADMLESEMQILSEEQESAPTPEARKEILGRIGKLQQGLGRLKQQAKPFEYSHQGSLAYIGKEKAVADISWFYGNIASGGTMTFLFWRSAYVSMCFSTRNKILVVVDWIKSRLFGRDVSRE